jgi:hypothetical protein
MNTCIKTSLPPKPKTPSLENMAKRITHRYRKPYSKKFFPIVRSGKVRELHLLLNSEENWMGLEKLLSIRDGFGNTAVIIAASEGNSAMLEYLLLQIEKCKTIDIKLVGIDSKNNNGWSAIHFAAHLDRHLILDLLLQKGCDLYAKTRNSRTALDLALRMKHEQCVSILLLYGCPFPLSVLGRYGAFNIENERNNIVCKNGSMNYEDVQQDMKELFNEKILPGL